MSSDKADERDAQGRLLPGNNLGVKGGRPAGTTMIERFRQYIAPHWDVIKDKLIEAAKAGDIKAAEIITQRMVPTPRPQAERIHVPGLREASTIADKADLIVEAVGNGSISVEAGRQALAMLADYARAKSIDEIEARLRALEGRGPDQARVINPDDWESLV